MLTFAVGDIHGMYDLLEKALKKIAEHTPNDQPSRVIFIGDYVDRGPQSKQVVTRLIAGSQNPNQEWICLRGNHDHYFAQAVLKNRDWDTYKTFGCYPTLGKYSYDVCDGNRIKFPITDPDIIAHAQWCANLPLMYEDEHRYYVHAGFAPGGHIDQQSSHTMIWIREEFLTSDYDFGKLVIHGHTPTYGNVDIRKNRINIDTGACFGQYLTVAVFEDNKDPIFWQFAGDLNHDYVHMD